MGRYDDITPEELQNRLRKFARLIRAMDKEGLLLEKAPSLLRILGELRQMIFAWEIRATRGLTSPEAPEEEDADPSTPEADDTDPTLSASLRIVREAVERERELQERLRDGHLREDGDS